jgi:hypothetical protein
MLGSRRLEGNRASLAGQVQRGQRLLDEGAQAAHEPMHVVLQHVLILGARHLRRILTSYSSYYNETRTHLSLDKDAPLGRAVQRHGTVVAVPILSGQHHRYART